MMLYKTALIIYKWSNLKAETDIGTQLYLFIYVLETQGKGTPEVNHRRNVWHTWLHKLKEKSHLDWSRHIETTLATSENTQD